MKTNLLKVIGISFCLLFVSIPTFAAPGLIHNWSGEGNAKDSIGSADGTLVNFSGTNDDGTPFTQDVSFGTGQVGHAFNFDGNGYIDFGTNVAAFGTSDFAITFWVQSTSTSEQSLLSKMDSYYLGRGFAISMTNGYIRCAIRSASGDAADNTNSADVTSLSRVNDGAFHHVAVERHGTDLYVFVDGVISGKASSTSVLNLPEAPYVVTNQIPIVNAKGQQMMLDGVTPFYIYEVDTVAQPVSFLVGAGPLGDGPFALVADSEGEVVTDQVGAGPLGQPFVGALDEIEIYGRALTAFEIYSVTHPGVGLAIIDQPLNQRALAGRPVIMHCLAVGVDPLTYQWQLNGLDIPGAISNNLVLDAPQTFDSGTYTVLVSNPTGDLMSRGATLVVTNLSTSNEGLLGRWSGEGTANDLLGLHNGITSNIKYVPGVLGTCFQFDGSSSVQCGNVLGHIGTQDFTIDFWLKTTANFPGGQDGMAVVAQRPICWWTDCLDFRLWSSGSSLTYMDVSLGDHRDVSNPQYNSAEPTSALSSLHLNDGVFHHIAAVRSSNTFTLYMDGTYIQSVQSYEPCYLNNEGSFNLGINPCGNPFVGCLDEVEVFSRALSDQEIFNTYSPGAGLSIMRQPLTTSAAENSAASLTVSAVGLDPISYQWRLNGTAIAGATSSTYSLASAAESDAGVYTVLVSNPAGSVVSASAQLNIVPTDSILPGLVNRWSAEGNYLDSMGNASCNVGASSFAPGVSGQAFKLSGGNDSIGLGFNTGQVGYSDFTWAFWLRYESDGTIIATIPAYRFSATSGQIKVQLGDGTRDPGPWNIMDLGFTTTAPTLINDGQFHHVAIARQDTTNLLIYIDGSNVLQTVMPAFDLEDRWGLSFGDDYGRTKRFGGELDELELYNRALTSDEVAQLYNRYANAPRADYTLRDFGAQMGSSFTLSAGAATLNGPGPLSYQWTLNGVVIAGATDSTYTVGSVDASSAGIYAVTMTTPGGSVSSPIARVSIQLSAGSYNGLFYLDSDVTDDASGFITLTLDISQTFSGSILQKGNKYPFTGKLPGTTSTVQVKRGKLAPLTLTLSGANPDLITGTVHDATHSVPMQAHRIVYSSSHPTPQVGTYTLDLVGISSAKAPNGHGFGNATISSSGLVKFVANLADDTVVSQGASVAGSGIWPIYIPAYKNKGSLLGWLSFTNNASSVCAGTLRWVKAPGAIGKYYKSGFATKVPVLGSTFAAQSTGLGIGLNNSSVVLDGAKIYDAVNDPIVGTTANKITFNQTIGGKSLLTVTPKLGRFTGSFLNPRTHKKEPVKGIVLQNQAYAAGYFISSNLSGRVVLQHN